MEQVYLDDGIAPKEYQNINGLIGVLIANRVATLQELRTIYSLEDAMNMYEAIIIPKFNEWRAAKHAANKTRR